MLRTTGVQLQCVNMAHIATYGNVSNVPTHGWARRQLCRDKAERKAADVGEMGGKKGKEDLW